jgi:hypothetical protein
MFRLRLLSYGLIAWLGSVGSACADAVSYDVIFARAYLGGVPCETVSGDGYAQAPVTVWNSPDEKDVAAHPVMLQTACTQGGGDCTCHILYSQEHAVAGQPTTSFVQVWSADKKPVWLKVTTSDKKPLLDLAKGGSTDIEFREQHPVMYSDAALTHTITKEHLFDAPKEIQAQAKKYLAQHPSSQSMQDSGLTGIQHRIQPHVGNINVKGQTFTRISVFLSVATENQDGEIITKDFFLRDVFVQNFDAQGRINYWTETVGC